VPLLSAVDRGFWRRKAFRCSRLHLDEAKDTVIPTNQVDLATALWDAQVRRNQAITLAAQKQVSFHLSTPGSAQVLGNCSAQVATC
jgi:hypothetical protein